MREHDLPEDLRATAEAVAGLPRPQPKYDLAERTLARIAGDESRPKAGETNRARPWWLRQITNPLARAAAALLLIAILGLLANLDTAEKVGLFSERIIGSQTTDRVERALDRVFVALGPVEVRDKDIVRLVGSELPERDPVTKDPGDQPRTMRDGAQPSMRMAISA